MTGETTGIEWTDSTWSPWRGCTKKSPGCKNCYVERLEARFGNDFSTVRRASPKTFAAPLRWKGARMIFTCSMSDFFHEDADEWRDEAWEVIRQTPQHTYQVLTKRPERIQDCLPETCFTCGNDAREGDCDCSDWAYWNTKSKWPAPGYWPNVWLGVSVETQAYAYRIAQLVEVPARLHFLSCEPLLGPLNLDFDPGYYWFASIGWVIVGGESGPNCRFMEEAWALDILEQCRPRDVPFFFKQRGGRTKVDGAWGGRELDGREWNEMPEARPEPQPRRQREV